MQVRRETVRNPGTFTAARINRVVGVREPLLERGEQRLHLVPLVADHPQRAALLLHRPVRDHALLHLREPQQPAKLVGDRLVLTHQDADVGEVEQVLGDLRGLTALVAGRERVGRLVVGHQLDVALGAGEPQVGVQRLDRLEREAGLQPCLVAEHDPAIARRRGLSHALAPGVEAHQGDADGDLVAGLMQRTQRQGLDRLAPVRLEGRLGVEHALQRALAQGTQRVAQRTGSVVEVLPRGVAAVGHQVLRGGVQRGPHLWDGHRLQSGRAGRPAGQVPQHLVDDPLLGRAERHALGGDQAADQHEPAVEDHRGALLLLLNGLLLPVHAERAEVQRVDPARRVRDRSGTGRRRGTGRGPRTRP